MSSKIITTPKKKPSNFLLAKFKVFCIILYSKKPSLLFPSDLIKHKLSIEESSKNENLLFPEIKTIKCDETNNSARLVNWKLNEKRHRLRNNLLNRSSIGPTNKQEKHIFETPQNIIEPLNLSLSADSRKSYIRKYYRPTPRSIIGVWIPKEKLGEDIENSPFIKSVYKTNAKIRRLINHNIRSENFESVRMSPTKEISDLSAINTQIQSPEPMPKYEPPKFKLTINNCVQLLQEKVHEIRGEIDIHDKNKNYADEIRKEMPRLNYWNMTPGDKLNIVNKISQVEKKRLLQKVINFANKSSFQ